MADIADVVRQQADALMLCGETAAGLFPDKCVGVLRAVATSIEEWCRCSALMACCDQCRGLTRSLGYSHKNTDRTVHWLSHQCSAVSGGGA